MRFLTLFSLALLGLAEAKIDTRGYIHTPSLSARNFRTSNNSYVKIDGDVCTVSPIGAAEDDGPNLLYAFSLCSTQSLINLPGFYTVNTVLNTTLTNVEIRLTGAIQYTADIAYWSPNSIYLTYQNATTFWLFQGSGITFHGGGTIDASGQVWWEKFAQNTIKGVAGGSSTVFARPIPLTVANAENVVVSDLSITNSPFWHNFVYQSKNIMYDNIRIKSISYNVSAPAANSDGWDIYRSSYVTVKNSHVINGDDCVSLKPNSTYVEVLNMFCNGSHGVSVGSLGQYAGQTDIVANVLVKNITMLNAENGARIKVFGGSNDTKSVSGGGSGYVKNVTFQDFYNFNVDNPIYLTQCYSTLAAQCIAFPATLQISDVHYINVTGSTSGKVNSTVASLECSAQCVGVTSTGTKLVPKDGSKPVYLCANLQNEGALDFPCTNVNITKG